MNLRTYPPFLLASLLLAGACSSSSSSGTPDGSTTQDAHVEDVASNTETGTTIQDAAADTTTALDANEAAAPPPTCGGPTDRYTLLTGANAGLVEDNETGLIWMSDSVGGGERVGEGGPQTEEDAAAYCSGRGMRLPTKDEALALATTDLPCQEGSLSFPTTAPPTQCLCGNGKLPFGGWSTWTSTYEGGDSEALVVDYSATVTPQVADNFPSSVLCVRGSTD
jgi:hypothetical protein